MAALAQANTKGVEGQKASAEYFALEYRLDHLIATYRKPYVAYMDGITMGGGVGLSVHAPFRIATERTVFAMPETTIGFFPDVGASFFLPRMDGQVGKYLALTSERLTGPNAFYAGVATHYMHSSALKALTARLSELVFKDYESMQDRLHTINTTIEEFNTGLPPDQPMLLAGELRQAIDDCFHPHDLQEIVLRLEKMAATDVSTSAWARQTLDTLGQRSPTSLKVALKQLALASRWNIADTFQREYQMARVFMARHDFTEGVLARLVEKRKPQWNPSDFRQVADAEVEQYFDVADAELELLTPGNYREYPAAWIGLPRESIVEDAVRRHGFQTPSEVVDYFVRESAGKLGVQAKVEEIVRRKTVSDEKGVRWKDNESA